MCFCWSQLAICGWYRMMLPPLGVEYARGQPPSGAAGDAPGLGAAAGFAAAGAGFAGAAVFPGAAVWGMAGAAKSGAAGDRINAAAVTIATTPRSTTLL